MLPSSLAYGENCYLHYIIKGKSISPKGLLYSILFELLLCLAIPLRVVDAVAVFVNILVHICIHVIGIHILITTQVLSLYFRLTRSLF